MDISDDIVEFLTEQYSEPELEPFILCIGVYAEPHFKSIECFKSWWQIDNLALAGKSPEDLAQTKEGLEQVMQYLVVRSHN